MLRRERIIERIDHSFQFNRVASLVAPAGFGKTIALEQWLQRQSSKVIRFDIAEAGLHTIDLLVTALLEAFETANVAIPRFESIAVKLLVYLSVFDGYIAIDGFEACAPTNEADWEYFKAMVLVSKCKWIFATSMPAGLPLGEWLAYGVSDLAVDEWDLSFSAEELQLLANSVHATLDHDAISAARETPHSPREIVAEIETQLSLQSD